jgi:glutathione S-transferase
VLHFDDRIARCLDGDLIGDSEIIRWHLERKYGTDFGLGLASEQQALAHAFVRKVEECIFWVLVYTCWFDDRHWPVICKEFFGGPSLVVRTLVAGRARSNTWRQLWGHGMGRHLPDEIYAMGVADIRVIPAQLGDKPYLMGAEPTGADASVFPIIANLLYHNRSNRLSRTRSRSAPSLSPTQGGCGRATSAERDRPRPRADSVAALHARARRRVRSRDGQRDP